MAILERFSDIIKANINVLLDKMEDPEKMIDQYLEDMMKDLAEVKQSTAEVMAEETRTKRLVEQNEAEVAKYNEYAKKALLAGNEEDARVFLNKKQELENVGAGLMTAYAAAHENAVKMRQMHDKLTSDIETLRARRQAIKSKIKVAKTQETLNEATQATKKIAGTKSAFERMEDKANRMLDEANAMAELNMEPIDEAKALEAKYASMGNASVDEELKKLKEELGL
ncbi:MAG TPA: PspA/IM30 family protein [Sedimentibacter sp.]|jgi:phage shock protein A|nr:PspA/IM30 family protein [Sedimentibacter sp.]HHZ00823.1 PspA/IM30 family protein [Tissierellia bacterium]HOW24018.1 PspA/IM30 family protein [Sedimentibacter sp.]HRC81122.1 PspA/IM30 family protein [Sedimentibacter sp.]